MDSRSLVAFLFTLLPLAAPAASAADFTGYYPLTAAYGYYERTDHFATSDDGIPQSELTTIDLDDSALSDDLDEGYLVILSNGQVTGHWVQKLNFTAVWNGVYRWIYTFSGAIFPEARLNVDVTGTVLAQSETSVTLQLDALIDCTYTDSGGYAKGGFQRFVPSPTAWSAADIPLQFTVTAQRGPDGSLFFEIPTARDVLPALAAASPADAGVAIRNFAWPQTRQPFLYEGGQESVIPGLGVLDGAEISIGAWRLGPTGFNFAAPFTGLKPVFSEYYLLDVAAPFGFIATSTQGNLPGVQTAHFHYGSEESVQSLEGGRAFAPFDYGDAAELITAEVLSGGVVVENLSRPLTKVPVPPWAAPASAWSATPGVRYACTLAWPVSLATTQTLASASILTGLWGITGAAESEMNVLADSLGTPTPGTLEGRVNFHAAGKDIGFTLGGTHAATLNPSGLSLVGNCETSPLVVPLLEANITPLSLVPGLQTAVANVHPFFQRLIRGTGLGIRSELSMSAAGDYAAEVADAAPRFTSGSITGAVDVSARLNILPQMMRDFLYLGIEGGGGLETEISLAPNVAMTSLGGHLYFSAVASLFGLEAVAQHDYAFGDYVPPAPVAARAMTRRSPMPKAAPLALVAAMPPAASLSARANIAVSFAAEPYSTTPTIVVASLPQPGQPAPASEITLRETNPFGAWTSRSVPSSGAANLAPTIGRAKLRSPSSNREDPVQAIVWSRSTTALPATAAEHDAFANGMELQFREYSALLGAMGVSYPLTANTLCDFGAAIPQVTGSEAVRVFWARSHGTDFTGSTTPLTLHTRRWLKRDAGELTGWSEEVQAVGGLSHVVDWRAIVLDSMNAAIVITRDTDGDFSTLDDTELWLARETEGVWGAPVQITTNAVADEQPVMFYHFSALRLAWRQGGDVVYLPDAFTSSVAQLLLPASAAPGGGFARATFGVRTAAVGSGLFLAWPEGTQLAFTFEGMSSPASGALLPLPRYVPMGADTVSGFAATLRDFGDSNYLETVTTTTGATAGSPSTVPATTEARLAWSGATIGLFEQPAIYVESASTPASQTLALGAELLLRPSVELRAGVTYQWFRDGQLIPGAVSSTYRQAVTTAADTGYYTLRITDGSGASDYSIGTVTIEETFAAWTLAQGLTAPLDTREADADADGAPNDLEYLFGTDPRDPASRPATSFYPAEVSEYGLPFDSFTFNVSAAATDCDFVIENSHDLVTWIDAQGLASLYGNYAGTFSSSADGRTRNYVALIPNYAGVGYAIPSVDWTHSFMRVRMIRP